MGGGGIIIQLRMSGLYMIIIRVLTILDKFYQHISGVHIQHNEGSQSGSVLLVQLASDYCHNVRNLSVVQFKVSLQGLYIESSTQRTLNV